MYSKRRFSSAFKVTIILCCLIGILSNLIKTTSLASIFSFYTMQSNLLVLVFYLGYFIIRKFRPNFDNSNVYYILKGAVIMAIFLTFVVYNISLQQLDFMMDVRTSSSNILNLSNIFVHFINPILVFIDYIIFDEKGRFKPKYIPAWCIFPALYPVYVYTYAYLGGRFFGVGGSKKYAYFFLDIDKIGIDGVAGYLLLFTIIFIMVSFLVVKFDGLLKKRKERKKH